ncbi:hypothetical protein ACVGW8_00085, partial [Enterobacter hormaechei]
WHLAGCSFLVSLKSFMGELRYWARQAGAQGHFTVSATPKLETKQNKQSVTPPTNATTKN